MKIVVDKIVVLSGIAILIVEINVLLEYNEKLRLIILMIVTNVLIVRKIILMEVKIFVYSDEHIDGGRKMRYRNISGDYQLSLQ